MGWETTKEYQSYSKAVNDKPHLNVTCLENPTRGHHKLAVTIFKLFKIFSAGYRIEGVVKGDIRNRDNLNRGQHIFIY